MTKKLRSKTPARTTYRHGDLRRALLEAGIALARAGGPDAVVLREATRRAGVVPNAAYRHFANRQDLLEAVRSAALAELAKTMEAEIARMRRGKSGAEAARANLRAVGTGYLRFALGGNRPVPHRLRDAGVPRFIGDPARARRERPQPVRAPERGAGRAGRTGLLPPERRPARSSSPGPPSMALPCW